MRVIFLARLAVWCAAAHKWFHRCCKNSGQLHVTSGSSRSYLGQRPPPRQQQLSPSQIFYRYRPAAAWIAQSQSGCWVYARHEQVFSAVSRHCRTLWLLPAIGLLQTGAWRGHRPLWNDQRHSSSDEGDNRAMFASIAIGATPLPWVQIVLH